MNSILCRKALTFKVRAFFLFFILFSGCQTENRKTSQLPAPASVNSNSIKYSSPEIVISFLGDVIIHERIRKREESSNEGFQTIWAEIQKYLDASDISYANLEGPVAPEVGGVSGFPNFNFPEVIIPTLKAAGFDILSTANNHALDRGALGISTTIQNLKKSRLSYTGTVSSQQHLLESNETYWGFTAIPKSELKVAWIACTEMTNGHRDRESQVLYCYKDENKIKDMINALRSDPTVVGIIVTPHWGQEEKFEIEPHRRSWAHKMINEGATSVVGSHPHVLQAVEDFTTQDGRKTFIAYSMGNFVSNQPKTPNKTSMMLLAKFKLGVNLKLEMTDLKYISLWMSRTIEKDDSAKYRISPVWDLKKVPAEAAQIWKDQLGLERRFKNEAEINQFFTK